MVDFSLFTLKKKMHSHTTKVESHMRRKAPQKEVIYELSLLSTLFEVAYQEGSYARLFNHIKMITNFPDLPVI